jgi:hypothetical protein
MFGYGEGRLPCHPDILNAAAIRPIGEFYWVGKVGTDWCSEGKCWVTWEWDFTGEIPPKIEFAKDTVIVCAEVEHCTTTLARVSPGILSLIATVHCPADSEDLPPPEPIVLDPIYLILTLGGCSAPIFGSSPQPQSCEHPLAVNITVTQPSTSCYSYYEAIPVIAEDQEYISFTPETHTDEIVISFDSSDVYAELFIAYYVSSIVSNFGGLVPNEARFIANTTGRFDYDIPVTVRFYSSCDNSVLGDVGIWVMAVS